MMLKRLPFFLVLLQLGACSSSLDERFYGTWVNPTGETERVIFRENGTVSWFGEEGTFESYKYKKGCHPHAIFPCMGGGGHGLEVSVSGDTHKIRPNFDTYQDSWWLFPKGDTLSPQNSHYGVLLLRSGTFETPIMPEDFTKLGAGWSIPVNHGYKGSETYFDSNSEHAMVLSADPLLAGLKWGHTIFAYQESTDSWERQLQSDYGAGHLIGKELILHKSSGWDEAADGYVDHFRTSFDRGATWNTLPQLGDGNYSDRANYEYGLTGSTIVQQINVNPPRNCALDNDCEPQDRNYEIWTLDATADSPSWVLRTSFMIPRNVYVGPKLYTHPTTGTIAIAWSAYYNDDRSFNEAQISNDRGVTWQPFDHDCHVPDGVFLREVLIPHQQGFFCPDQQGKVRWYSSTTNTWSTHTLVRDELVNHGDPTDGAYIRRGDEVIKWQPDGTETLLTTLSPSLGYGDIFVFDDEVIVNKFGLWRAWR